jgi:5-bromo-4-chloroindolyl phosphate hydrolysis protein
MSDKAIRSWLASFIFLTLVVGLIFFLTFLEIPEKNKDIVTSIIGMLIGSISMAISIFVGRDPDDVMALKGEIEKFHQDRNTLIERLRDAQIDKDILRRQLEELQNNIIDKLSIFVGEKRLKQIGNNNTQAMEQTERWIPKEKKKNPEGTFSTIPPKPVPSPLDDIFNGK